MKNLTLAVALGVFGFPLGAEEALSQDAPASGGSAKSSVIDWLDLAEEKQSYIMKQAGTIRIGPNAAFSAIGVAKEGEIIEAVGRARSWIAFDYDGQIAFIWDGLVNKWQSWPTSTVGSSPSPEIAPTEIAPAPET